MLHIDCAIWVELVQCKNMPINVFPALLSTSKRTRVYEAKSKNDTIFSSTKYSILVISARTLHYQILRVIIRKLKEKSKGFILEEQFDSRGY